MTEREVCKCRKLFDGFMNVRNMILANKQVLIVERNLDVNQLDTNLTTVNTPLNVSEGQWFIAESIPETMQSFNTNSITTPSSKQESSICITNKDDLLKHKNTTTSTSDKLLVNKESVVMAERIPFTSVQLQGGQP